MKFYIFLLIASLSALSVQGMYKAATTATKTVSAGEKARINLAIVVQAEKIFLDSTITPGERILYICGLQKNPYLLESTKIRIGQLTSTIERSMPRLRLPAAHTDAEDLC